MPTMQTTLYVVPTIGRRKGDWSACRLGWSKRSGTSTNPKTKTATKNSKKNLGGSDLDKLILLEHRFDFAQHSPLNHVPERAPFHRIA